MRIFRFSVLASAIAAGCAAAPPDNTYAFKAGNGTVENVRQARVQIPGGTAPATPLKQMTEPRWIDGYQLTLRMDDGTTQAITQDTAAFHAGDRIQVTSNGRVVRLPFGATTPVAVLLPGTGTVQSVVANTASAAAGGSAAGQQAEIRMDNGATQWVSVQDSTLRPGERVSVTADGLVVR